MINQKNIIIVVHKVHTNPDDDLVIYLNKHKYDNVLHIRHSFSDIQNRCSYYTWYKKGQIFKSGKTIDFSFLPEPLIYLKELLTTLWWIIISGHRWYRYIGMDGLCANFGLLLRKIFIEKIICWNIDFVPENRFQSKYKNIIYRIINVNAFKNCDEMWDHTLKMAREKEKVLGIKTSNYNVHKIVPLGTWNDRITKINYKNCDKHTAVFMGHLLEKQGAQIILAAIPHIIKSVPDFKFKIIGDGYFKNELIKLTNQLKINKYVKFLGKIESDTMMEKKIAKCSLGVAPYIKSIDTYTKFGADPGKIKTYLACGLPILLTDVPYNAQKIAKYGCGIIINEDPKQVAKHIIKIITNNRINQDMRNKAIKFAKTFDYNHIFTTLGL